MKSNFPDGKYAKRSYDVQDIRSGAEDGVIEGHAAVYGQTVNIGNLFYEVIAQGAFDRANLSDVALFLNHDIDKIPLARSRKNVPNSTMKVVPDDKGLFMSANIDVGNNSDSRALKSAIDRKDISGMSFAFLVEDEEWAGLDTDMPTRTIKAISKVIEVSAVTYPAYSGTDIKARSKSLESDKAALERAKSALSLSEAVLLKQKISMKGKV